MRIIGGKYRGRVLTGFKGWDIRPTSDRVKESLFNILAPEISGANVLDLFCGSGSVGLEAISRGADLVVFNDASKDSLAVLKKNLALIGASAPVYNLGEEALRLIASRRLLNTGGVAVLESDKPFAGEISDLVRYDERKYGIAYLTFFSPD